jgi:hypothetical protein
MADPNGTTARLLEALELRESVLIVNARARRVLRDAATYVLYDVPEPDDIQIVRGLVWIVSFACFPCRTRSLI